MVSKLDLHRRADKLLKRELGMSLAEANTYGLVGFYSEEMMDVLRGRTRLGDLFSSTALRALKQCGIVEGGGNKLRLSERCLAVMFSLGFTHPRPFVDPRKMPH